MDFQSEQDTFDDLYNAQSHPPILQYSKAYSLANQAVLALKSPGLPWNPPSKHQIIKTGTLQKRNPQEIHTKGSNFTSLLQFFGKITKWFFFKMEKDYIYQKRKKNMNANGYFNKYPSRKMIKY
jgi:hypothetical protein